MAMTARRRQDVRFSTPGHQRCVRLIDVRPLLRRQPLLGLIEPVQVLTNQAIGLFPELSGFLHGRALIREVPVV